MKCMIKIKPLSVNQAWKGRRYKTKKYKEYENDLTNLLTYIEVPKGKLFLNIKFGLSNPNSDWDNPIKPFQDILQKKYGFNDRMVYGAKVIKENVTKGDEYVEFEITRYNE